MAVSASANVGVRAIGRAAKPSTVGAAPKLVITEAKVIASADQTQGWKLLRELQAQEADALGPFYNRVMGVSTEPGKVDIRTTQAWEGYRVVGTVRDAESGALLPNTKLQIWLDDPDLEYRIPTGRAELVTDAKGGFELRTNKPKPYLGRPAHLHYLADKEGRHIHIGQTYPMERPQGPPRPGEAERLDIVLEPILPGQQRHVKVIQGNQWTPDGPTRDGKPDGFIGQWNGPALSNEEARIPFKVSDAGPDADRWV